MAGLYVHIPFCKSRCVYCGFYSTTLHSLRQRYVDAVVRELELRGDYCDRNWQTVYLGGGTPSALDGCQLEKLFAAIDCNGAKEITLECNPDDVDEGFAALVKVLPVNRISLGTQTFDDNRLKFLRRRHTSADVARAVGMLRRVGIENISVDLMYGFPDETLEEWDSDIDAALQLGVEHLSAYCLMYEEGTPLWKMREEGMVTEADEELTRSMYYRLIDRLASEGYEHYEVSNFAREGRRSIHNSSYWTGVPYMGLGAAAHSYDGKSRQWNVNDLLLYINKVENGILPFTKEELDDQERYNDMVMLRLRTCEGIDLGMMEREFGSDAVEECLRLAGKYVSSGLLKTDGCRLRLSREGWYVSDMVMSELMKV